MRRQEKIRLETTPREAEQGRVRCGGKLHRISLMPDGRLRFWDHDRSLQLSEDLARLAHYQIAPACRCAAELRWWRTGATWVGTYLDGRPAAKTVSAVAKKHRTERDRVAKLRWDCRANEIWAGAPLSQRLWHRTINAATRTWETCEYREPSGKWAGGDVELYIDAAAHAYARSETRREYSGNGKWEGRSLDVTLGLRRNWYLRVYRPGFAIARYNGAARFVLDVRPGGRDTRADDTVLAVVAWQQRGLGIGTKTVELSLDGLRIRRP